MKMVKKKLWAIILGAAIVLAGCRDGQIGVILDVLLITQETGNIM